jgi:hypothetical protein
MTLTELQSSKRVTLRRSSGYVARVSGNSPSVAVIYEVIYTRPNGERLVIGKAKSNRSEEKARAAAFAAALAWANE